MHHVVKISEVIDLKSNCIRDIFLCHSKYCCRSLRGPPINVTLFVHFCFWTRRRMKPRSKADWRPMHFFVINADVRCIVFQCSRVAMHGLANVLTLISRCGIHYPPSTERTCTLESICRERGECSFPAERFQNAEGGRKTSMAHAHVLVPDGHVASSTSWRIRK